MIYTLPRWFRYSLFQPLAEEHTWEDYLKKMHLKKIFVANPFEERWKCPVYLFINISGIREQLDSLSFMELVIFFFSDFVMFFFASTG